MMYLPIPLDDGPIWYVLSRYLFPLPNRDLKRLQAIATNDLDRSGFANAVACQVDVQIFGVLNGMAIERDKDITDQQATLLRGTILVNFNDEQPLLLCSTGPLRDWQLDPLAADAQIATFDIALFGQCLCDGAGNLDGDGQCDPIDQSGRQYTHHIALCVNQRTTGEAGIRDCVSANVAFEYLALACA